MPPAVAGAGEALGKKDLQLFISITFSLLLFFLILAFDRHSLSSVGSFYVAVFNPVFYSVFFFGAMPLLPWILTHRILKPLLLAMLALSCSGTVFFTGMAHPSFMWEFLLYLSFAAWGAFVDAVLEVSSFISLIFSGQTIAFVLLHSGGVAS